MSDDQVVDDTGALFGVDELVVDVGKVGRVEAGCYRALRAGERDGVVLDLDAGLAAAALATARRLDEAERAAAHRLDLKPGYLYAQLLTPYRELMQALRLPAQVEPAVEPRATQPTAGGDVPSWLHDLAGSAE